MQILLLWGLFFALVFSVSNAVAQSPTSPDNIWHEISNQELTAYRDNDPTPEYWIHPDKFLAFSLDKAALEDELGAAPLERLALAAELQPEPAIIYLPSPDGNYMPFEFMESSIMAPDLQAKFPEIRTYAGTSVEDSSVKVRFDYTPAGFHAQVLVPNARWYIDPHFQGDTTMYVSYYKTDYHPTKEPGQCLLKGGEALGRSFEFQARSGNKLRHYRLAVAATGEYSAFHGGTKEGALAAITTTINRVTGIYEREMAIRLILIGNADTIVYTDPTTDPFIGNDDADILIDESQTVINTNIGATNYDIGHTFSTGAGGLAGLGVVCNDSKKAEGVTGQSHPVGDPFDVDYVAHEIGHQFGADHTFNGINGNCAGDQRNAATAYEPGSGSTILAYAGICNEDNLQEHSDEIFHSATHEAIIDYVSANTCGTTTPLANAIPLANAGADYSIPAQTPFVLTGSGNDTDTGDTLTFLWEEHDLGPPAALDAEDDGHIPLFRVFTPTAKPVRYLPRLATLASNTKDNAEKLPTEGRSMNWRLIVRDNKGGVNSDYARVIVDPNSGPFQITSPNGGETLSGTINVNWNVANTTNSPVSTANVDIFLSTDGGLTFDLDNPLAKGTPNDGSHPVTLPTVPIEQGRIMVKGANNIFFDISNQNFSVRSVVNKFLKLGRVVTAIESSVFRNDPHLLCPETDPNNRSTWKIFAINPEFINTSQTSLRGLQYVVRTLSGGNSLINADGAPPAGGVGSTVTISDNLLGPDGLLKPSESFHDQTNEGKASFFICLASRSTFEFFVDVMGIPTQ